MREELIELDYGVVEKRIYDQDGKLVEVRKIYPSDTPVQGKAWVKRTPGASGGHEF